MVVDMFWPVPEGDYGGPNIDRTTTPHTLQYRYPRNYDLRIPVGALGVFKVMVYFPNGKIQYLGYHLVNIYTKTMENHNFKWVNQQTNHNFQ
jgi:hypothetical protein